MSAPATPPSGWAIAFYIVVAAVLLGIYFRLIP